MSIFIADMIGETLNEWKGHISTIIFLRGCNLRCPYCHGWRFLDKTVCPGPIEPSEVLSHLKNNLNWIDGLVVSGGEPTCSSGLIEFLESVRDLGVQIKLHSNGTNPPILKNLLSKGLIDCLALDYKCYKIDQFIKLGGTEEQFRSVSETFDMVRKIDIEKEFHTTACPSIIDNNDLLVMADRLQQDGTWYIQKYNPGDVLDSNNAGEDSTPLSELLDISMEIKLVHKEVVILGVSS